ncbi:MAG: trypsin-like peptidase domain-containing protein, partial [Patescibacteria group bacterium]
TPGDSDHLKTGQTVVALGSGSGGISGVGAALGIISGFGSIVFEPNSGLELREPQKTIETSALINSENSGGPLLDMAGNVIGVNAVIINGSEHVRFALPINFAKKIIAELNSAN